MTPAEAIASAVLESHGAAWYVTEPTQHERRQRVIESAAKALQPILDALLADHAKAAAAQNPT